MNAERIQNLETRFVEEFARGVARYEDYKKSHPNDTKYAEIIRIGNDIKFKIHAEFIALARRFSHAKSKLSEKTFMYGVAPFLENVHDFSEDDWEECRTVDIIVPWDGVPNNYFHYTARFDIDNYRFMNDEICVDEYPDSDE